MSDVISLVGALLLGLLVPACARWLWKRVEGALGGFKDSILKELKDMRKEITSLSDRTSILEADSVLQGRKIAFLDGVHSERAATARAVLEAADLLNRPVNPAPTHVVVDSPTLADLKQDKE